MGNFITCAGVLTILAFAAVVLPCTRTVYLGPDGMIVTGRTLDWAEDMNSNMWVFPRAMPRDGGVDAGSIKWTSKYGSVVTSGYDVGTADGMNEKGLVANLLYLAESDYPKPDGKKPTLSIGAWAQYVLDNYATVADAVTALRAEPFVLVAPKLPNGAKSSLHLAISDPSGDSAIFEYIGGKLTIHHDRAYQVMTNSPAFDDQLALNKYWQNIGGMTMLPGTNRAADRFVRASFYINAVTKSADPRRAVAASFSVMRNASVPLGVSVEGQPNIATTYWLTVADQKNRVYFFQHTLSPGALWIRLDKLDFSEKSGTRKLTLAGHYDIVGDATDKFEKAEPFKFLTQE